MPVADKDRRAQRPEDPEPLPDVPGGMVDNHTHLDHESDDAAVRVLLDRAAAAGVPRAVTIGCDLESARWTAGAVTRFSQLLGGVAIHPNEAPELKARGELDDALCEIAELATHDRIRVVGETGMDAFRTDHDDAAAKRAQEESFRAHIELAKRLGKPMQIHDRDTHADVLRILADAGAPDVTVFHCFSGDVEMARFCAAQGWYLSFPGTITFKPNDELRRALAAIPLEQVLVETDAPYLTPVPHRGRPNASYLVPLTVRCMAEVLDRPTREICETVAATSERLYGPW